VSSFSISSSSPFCRIFYIFLFLFFFPVDFTAFSAKIPLLSGNQCSAFLCVGVVDFGTFRYGPEKYTQEKVKAARENVDIACSANLRFKIIIPASSGGLKTLLAYNVMTEHFFMVYKS